VEERRQTRLEQQDETRMLEETKRQPPEDFLVPLDMRGCLIYHPTVMHAKPIETSDEFHMLKPMNLDHVTSSIVWMNKDQVESNIVPPLRRIRDQPAHYLQYVQFSEQSRWDERFGSVFTPNQVKSLENTLLNNTTVFPKVLIHLLMEYLQAWTQTIAWVIDQRNTIFPVLQPTCVETQDNKRDFLYISSNERKWTIARSVNRFGHIVYFLRVR
jgi:hypothetical protein